MKRFFNIDFFRFLSAIGLVYFHLLHYNLPARYIYEYTPLINSTNTTYIIVELFLIISGFFLYKTSHHEQSILKFSANRLVRLYPAFLFYALLTLITSPYAAQFFWDNILMLQCTQIIPTCSGIIWFVAPFFWACILIYTILKKFPKINKHIILILLILTYFTMEILSNGYFNTFTPITPYLNFAMLRVIAGICAGVTIGFISEKAQKIHIPNILLNITEILCIVPIVTHLFIRPVFSNDIYCVLIFSVFVFLLTLNKSIISRLTNRPTLGHLGRYAYCIYIMQQVSFDILNHTPIAHHASPNQTLVIYILLSTLIGILTYYIAERPIIWLYKNFTSCKFLQTTHH